MDEEITGTEVCLMDDDYNFANVYLATNINEYRKFLIIGPTRYILTFPGDGLALAQYSVDTKTRNYTIPEEDSFELPEDHPLEQPRVRVSF